MLIDGFEVIEGHLATIDGRSSCNHTCNQIAWDFILSLRGLYLGWSRKGRNGRHLLVEPQVRVSVRRQLWIGVASELLGGGQRDTGASEVADERVAVGVKVGEQALFVLVGDPSVGQIFAHHLGRLAKMAFGGLEHKQRFVWGNFALRRQPGADPFDDDRVERNSVLASSFAVARPYPDTRRRRIEIERTQRERRKFTSTISGPRCQDVEHGTVWTADGFNGGSIRGRSDQLRELVVR